MEKLTLKMFLRLGILVAIVVAVAVIGYSSTNSSSEDPVDAAPATTTEPVDTLPTSETVKIAIFERAYSECASTKLGLLAAKYKVAVKTKPSVAFAVGQAWTRYFEGNPDAVDSGRDGCLQGFKDA